MTRMEAAAGDLAEAVVQGSFTAAHRALADYRNAIESALPQMVPADARLRLEDACALVEWSRRNLCAARARLAEEIRHLDSLRQYHRCLTLSGQPNLDP